MTEQTFFPWLVWGFLGLAAVVFPALFFVKASYGRHQTPGRGVPVNSTLGWIVMESPSVLVFAACFFIAGPPEAIAARVLFVLWQIHYVYRTYVFPFLRRSRGSRSMDLSVAGSAIAFTTINAYLNGRYLFTFAPSGKYDASWLAEPRFLVGVTMFAAGLAINIGSDRILLGLRRPGETDYRIPHGGLFRWVSCPNYLGELIEWTGWAVMTWSLPGLVFALWTAANLVPRARAHHRWYQERFPEYPPERRAILPWVF